VSIVIPVRNEAENIAEAVRSVPQLCRQQEWIFVEGGSKDHTWAEIQKLPLLFPDKKIKFIQQTGNGKANAVREGFALAEGEILMILDGDLTMPPEELPKFYEALVKGGAEFANGTRLVYPMADGAMPFLNLCANKFFAVLFTWLIGQPVKDTLCGTKVLTKDSYERIAAGRDYFGDFDPFGDFDLLFGASRFNLKIADIPIRYRERTYGQTNISRWRHGAILLRMALVGAAKLKFI
jgi:glycosyltransferase involved in cell wall biosynthesis